MLQNIRKTVLCLIALLPFVCLSACVESCGDKNPHTKTHKSQLPQVKAAPEFSAENYDGNTFRSSSMKGNVWLASFMFTTCAGVCPVMNGHLSDVQKEFMKDSLKFVSISVDPDNDTREALAQYAKNYGAVSGKWFLVRMPIAEVRKLSVEGFLLSDPIEPSNHSPRYVLVDKQGQIRAYYDSMDSAKVQEMRSSIKDLLAEE